MSVFHFKQFSIHHHGAAMKVGTDGVLLGAWAEGPENMKRILDVGTGTGLIALMMAQRFPQVMIDAIDLDDAAVESAKKNIETSPWANRIIVEQIALQEFLHRATGKYDMIVCNPPYFSKGWRVENAGRKMARDAAHLPHQVLIDAAVELLSPGGFFNIILPVQEGTAFLRDSAERLFCSKCAALKIKEAREAKRILLQLTNLPVQTEYDTIIMEKTPGQEFTDQYKQLTGAFYLKF